jgi:hypothetical protein
VNAYGPVCAKEILLFNDAYYGLYEVCMRWEGKAGGREEHARQGGAWLAATERSLSSLSQQLPPGHRLVGELESYRDRQKRRFEELLQRDSSPGG